MLLKHSDEASGKVLKETHYSLLPATYGYVRPPESGPVWFMTTTSIWNCDELIGRRIRDWRRLLGETGHTGTRTLTMRSDHDSIYTGTHSVFPAPLAEWIILRYAGRVGGTILDAFAGGPPRAVIAAFMGYRYVGYDIRQEQIDEDKAVIQRLGLTAGIDYVLGDGTYLGGCKPGSMDFALTCPPYYDLERYSDLPDDLSNLGTYEAFDAAMLRCAHAHRRVMKPGAFVCIVTSCFRRKLNGENELQDFPGDTWRNFLKAGFHGWQRVILSRNFASAAVRATTSWRGKKLIPRHEELLVFKTPGGVKDE